jgi:hypothetical protein
MTKVYKYPFEIVGSQIVELPVEAKVIHVGLDPQGTPCLWAEINPLNIHKDLRIFVVGTGTSIPDAAKVHLGSFNQREFVWHVYSV